MKMVGVGVGVQAEKSTYPLGGTSMITPMNELVAEDITPEAEGGESELTICLCEKEIQALGLKELPRVGDEMMMQARVKVCEVSSNESDDAGLSRMVELEIVELGLEPKKKDAAKVAKEMYGG